MRKKGCCSLRLAPGDIPQLEFRGFYLTRDWGLEIGSVIELIHQCDQRMVFQLVPPDTCRKGKKIYTVGYVPMQKTESVPRLNIQGHYLVKKYGFCLGDKFQGYQERSYLVLHKIPTATVEHERAVKEYKFLKRQMKMSESRLHELQNQLTGVMA